MPCNIKEKIPDINCFLCKTAVICPDPNIRNAQIDILNAQIEANRPHEPIQSYGEYKLSYTKGENTKMRKNSTNIKGKRLS